MFALRHSPRLRPSSAGTRRRGLTRAELIWLLVLLGGLTYAILWTLGNDRAKARERHARDTLEYLAGHLRLVGDRERSSSWIPELAAGPGELPQLPQAGAPVALGELLPEGTYLPEDPWGRAYVCYWVEEDGTRYPVVGCGGESGRIGASPGLTRPLFPGGAPPF